MFDNGYLVVTCCVGMILILILFVGCAIVAKRYDKEVKRAEQSVPAVKTTKKTEVRKNSVEDFKVDAMFSVTGNPYVEGTVRYEAWERARR